MQKRNISERRIVWRCLWAYCSRKLARLNTEIYSPQYPLIFLLIFGGCFFIPHPDVPIREGRQIVFEWAIIALIALSLKNTWLKLFLLWTVVATALNYDKYSFIAMFIITIFLVMYEIMKSVSMKKSLNFWLNCICLAGLAQVPLCLLQLLDKDPIFEQTKYLIGFLDNPTLLSAFLAFCAPAFFRKKWLWGLALILPIIIYNGGRMAIFSLFFATGFYCIVRFGRQVVFSVILTFLILILYSMAFDREFNYRGRDTFTWNVIKEESSRRLLYWPRIWEMNTVSMQKSLLGCGPGRFKIVYNRDYQTPALRGAYGILTSAHNEPLQLWTEHGLIGVAIITGFLISLVCKFWKHKERLLLPACGLVAVIVNSLGNFPFHIPPLAFIAMFWAVLIERGNGPRISCVPSAYDCTR